MATKPVTPNLDKAKANKEKSELLGDFIEWVNDFDNKERGEILTDIANGDQEPEKLIAMYFEIDLDAMENEKEALIEYLQAESEAQHQGELTE